MRELCTLSERVMRGNGLPPVSPNELLPVEPAELDQGHYTSLGRRGLPGAHSSALRSQSPKVAAA